LKAGEHFGGAPLDSLVIAPQWIGDAVMTEPLMRRLAARGERLDRGRALPWVAPVYRAMPHVAEVIEFPFQHGGLQLKARRAIARQIEGRFDAAYVLPNSLKSALLPLLAGCAQARGLPGRGASGPADPPPEKPQEQATHGGLLFRTEW
jgi:heptosyltransferase-2